MTQRDSTRPGRTRVLIVDDHPVVRDGFKAQIATESDLEVSGEAEDVAGALQLFKSTQPELMVIDLSLKSSSGLELVKRIRAHSKVVKIVVWSMYSEDLYAERVLRAGANGYVHKGGSTHDIIDALREVRDGGVYLSGPQSGRLLTRLVGSGRGSEQSPIESLSDRELETFELMGQGRTTEEISVAMKVSPKTVDTYRARIKEKLNLENITELIHRATRWTLETRGNPGDVTE